jgi:hypothetical protein
LKKVEKIDVFINNNIFLDLDPALNQINFKDCQMNPYNLEFRNPDIEESYVEFYRKEAFVSEKWISISMALFLFGFNYFSYKDFEKYELLPFYLIHSYADLLFVFGFLLFIGGNRAYFHSLKQAVFLIKF